ncbi:MAG: undecaprenyl diphosphate synthase family protein, partial [Proteobacteria bacterium]|nr:undecaprenyl diphosphate synthase family protein [Pseudomonadota bacterium]
MKEKLPVHLAIIMDGNGRWAKKRNKSRVFGHREGIRVVREVID